MNLDVQYKMFSETCQMKLAVSTNVSDLPYCNGGDVFILLHAVRISCLTCLNLTLHDSGDRKQQISLNFKHCIADIDTWHLQIRANVF